MLSLLTTILDLLGAVLVVAGLAFAAGLLFVPAAFVVAGAGLLLLSWLFDFRARRAAAAGGAV